MKFLVILICLLINYLWLKDLDRFDDGWFFKLRSRVDKLTADLPNAASMAWLLNLILIYSIPLLLLGIVLLLIADSGFGLPTMLVHIIILLIAFDRTQPGKIAKDFIARWEEGDIEACALYVQEELGAPTDAEIRDEDSLSRYFSKQLTYRCFEKMFVMFFWYMLTGPMGVMFCYISYQLRDSHRPDQPQAEVKLVANAIYLLEWIPLRLLAMTFSLAGNFVQCFERVKQSFWEFSRDSDSAELLYGYAGCALSGLGRDAQGEAGQGDPAQADRQREKAEIEALLALLERSQAIWLAVLALITIFGLQIG